MNNLTPELFRVHGKRAVLIGLLLLFSPHIAMAITFEVSTAEELQAALNTSAATEGDDTIKLASGVYAGDFVYKAQLDGKLVIKSFEGGRASLVDGELNVVALEVETELVMQSMELKNFNVNTPRDHLKKVWLIDLKLQMAKMEIDAYDLKFEQVEASRLTLHSRRPQPHLTVDESILDFDVISSVSGGDRYYAGYTIVNSRMTFDRLELRDERGGENKIAGSVLEGSLILWGEGSPQITNSKFVSSGAITIWAVRDAVLESVTCEGGETGEPYFRFRESGNIRYFRNKCRFIASEAEGDLSVYSSLIGESSYSSQREGYSVTMTNNTGSKFSAEGVTGNFTLDNNIFWPNGISLTGFPNLATLRNNILGSKFGFFDIEGSNTYTNPLFFDSDGKDFHPREDSSAIDNGRSGSLSEEMLLDLDGNPRLVDGAVDIGAFERFTDALHPADSNGDRSISVRV